MALKWTLIVGKLKTAVEEILNINLQYEKARYICIYFFCSIEEIKQPMVFSESKSPFSRNFIVMT